MPKINSQIPLPTAFNYTWSGDAPSLVLQHLSSPLHDPRTGPSMVLTQRIYLHFVSTPRGEKTKVHAALGYTKIAAICSAEDLVYRETVIELREAALWEWSQENSCVAVFRAAFAQIS